MNWYIFLPEVVASIIASILISLAFFERPLLGLAEKSDGAITSTDTDGAQRRDIWSLPVRSFGYITKGLSNPFWGLSIFVIVFVLGWEGPSWMGKGHIEPHWIVHMLVRMRYHNPSIEVIYNIVAFGNKILMVFFPASLTIYFFIYRELRGTAISLQAQSIHFSLRRFIFITFYNIFYGAILDNVMSANVSKYPSTHHFGTVLVIRLLVWLLLTVLSVSTGWFMVRELYRSMDVSVIVTKEIQVAKKYVAYLGCRLPDWQYKIYFDSLGRTMESLYQLLGHIVSRDVTGIFPENFSRIVDMTYDLVKGTSSNNLPRKPSMYVALYKSILTHHVALISSLFSHGRNSEGIEAIGKMFELDPVDTLRDIEMVETQYFTELHELAMVVNSHKQQALSSFLIGLRELQVDSTTERMSGIIQIIKRLALSAISSNDVANLSATVYAVLPVPTPTHMGGNAYSAALRDVFDRHLANGAVDRSAVLRIVYELLIKSIESSKDACTGFLVKFTVTNFSSDEIDTSFSQFTENYQQILREDASATTFTRVSCSFNYDTFEYCMRKLAVLLYAQQKYLHQNHVVLGIHSVDSFIDLKTTKSRYASYVLKKLEQSGPRYGLLYFSDERFWRGVRYDVLAVQDPK